MFQSISIQIQVYWHLDRDMTGSCLLQKWLLNCTLAAASAGHWETWRQRGFLHAKVTKTTLYTDIHIYTYIRVCTHLFLSWFPDIFPSWYASSLLHLRSQRACSMPLSTQVPLAVRYGSAIGILVIPKGVSNCLKEPTIYRGEEC